MELSCEPLLMAEKLKFLILRIGTPVKRKKKMARVIINKLQMERTLSRIPAVQRNLDDKAERVLRKAQELAPKTTGDFARSLRVTRTVEGEKTVYRIVSDDPHAREIIRGTKGPYDSVPPSNPGSPLGDWGLRHGFVTSRSRYNLARKIAVHGTPPAGSYHGNEDWIKEALREAIR